MSYVKWITVNLQHKYFADGNCPALRFEPTAACRERMKRKGHFFYAMPGGFIIFKDTAKMKKDAGQMTGSNFFDIAMYTSDPLFGNYSNLDIDFRRGRVFYVGNTLKNSGKNKEETLTLTNPQKEGEDTRGVPVSLKPKQFVIFPDDAKAGDTVKLVDKNNKVIKEQGFTGKGSSKTLNIDVSNNGAGIYRLERNNQVISYFYADELLYQNPPSLIMGIEAGDNTANKEPNNILEYKILIGGRTVTWEYHVIAKANGRKLKNLEIKNNNKKLLPGVTFSQVHIDEERKEAVFLSNKSIPLSEKAYQSIELVEKGSGTPLIPHLPNASISSLSAKEGKWISRIYIYI